MGELVNLRQARKQKAREDKETTADQNRAKFGRTKAEKQLGAAEKSRAEKHVDAHKRESLDDSAKLLPTSDVLSITRWRIRMIKSTAVVTLATLLLSTASSASEDIAAQIDAIAPLIASNDLEQLQGPTDAAALLETIDGRWFTLNVTVRNWDSYDDKPGTVAHSVARLCSDDWENIVTLTATGPDRFHLEQRSPEGEDQGTMEMVSADPDGRRFIGVMSDEQILTLLQLGDADPVKQQEEIAAFREVIGGGADIWLPTPDLMVNATDAETEVWGRCPL